MTSSAQVGILGSSRRSRLNQPQQVITDSLPLLCKVEGPDTNGMFIVTYPARTKIKAFEWLGPPKSYPKSPGALDTTRFLPALSGWMRLAPPFSEFLRSIPNFFLLMRFFGSILRI